MAGIACDLNPDGSIRRIKAKYKRFDGSHKPVTIPASAWRDAGTVKDQRAAAKAWADECERYAMIARSGRATPHQLKHALELGVLTKDQLAALDVAGDPGGIFAVLDQSGVIASLSAGPKPVTVIDAADSHPSCKREYDKDPDAYKWHRGFLLKFLELNKPLTYLCDLTDDHLIAWVEHMRSIKSQRGKPYSDDTIRHSLYHVNYAIARADNYGLKGKLRVSKGENGQRILNLHCTPGDQAFWTLQEIGHAVRYWLAQPDEHIDKWRMLVVLGLGAFMGWRPSEIYRRKARDFSSGVGRIVKGTAKNTPSVRNVPIAPTVYSWIRALRSASCEAPDDLLLMTAKANGEVRNPFDRPSFARWFREAIQPAVLPTEMGVIVTRLTNSEMDVVLRATSGTKPLELDVRVGSCREVEVEPVNVWPNEQGVFVATVQLPQPMQRKAALRVVATYEGNATAKAMVPLTQIREGQTGQLKLVRKFTPKSLRKTFATWVQDCECMTAKARETFMGHRFQDGSKVTNTNYAQRQIQALVPAAQAIDQMLQLLIKEVPQNQWPARFQPGGSPQSDANGFLVIDPDELYEDLNRRA